MIVLLVRKTGTLQIGQEIDLPADEAEELIWQGHAEPVLDKTHRRIWPKKAGTQSPGNS